MNFTRGEVKKRRVKAETPQNRQQLELDPLKAGEIISKDETKSLVMSMGHRFTAVIPQPTEQFCLYCSNTFEGHCIYIYIYIYI